MDSSESDFLLTLTTLQNSEYCLGKGGSNLIDLGLSLKTLQPDQAYYPSPHENYEVLLDWQDLQPQQKTANNFHTQNAKQNLDHESEGTQSKQRWTYVKVNMDGLMVGRKICILDHVDYLSLARRLENMFGKQSMYGLRLFQDESQFMLFYKDRGVLEKRRGRSMEGVCESRKEAENRAQGSNDSSLASQNTCEINISM